MSCKIYRPAPTGKNTERKKTEASPSLPPHSHPDTAGDTARVINYLKFFLKASKYALSKSTMAKQETINMSEEVTGRLNYFKFCLTWK